MEEEEVRRMLRECLELRQAYVYKEEVAPWNQPLDATESEKNRDPFRFCPVEKTDVSSFYLIDTFNTLHLLCAVAHVSIGDGTNCSLLYFLMLMLVLFLSSMTLEWKMVLYMFTQVKMVRTAALFLRIIRFQSCWLMLLGAYFRHHGTFPCCKCN